MKTIFFLLILSSSAFAGIPNFTVFPPTGTVFADAKFCPAPQPCFQIPQLPSGDNADLSVLDLVNGALVINATRQAAFVAAQQAAATDANTRASRLAAIKTAAQACVTALQGTPTNAQVVQCLLLAVKLGAFDAIATGAL